MRPFLGSAIKQGLVAGLLASVLMAAIVYGVERHAINGVEMLGRGDVANIVGVVVVLGVVVTVAFSALAVNKFVNMRSNKIYLY
jgi:cell division transport system permease protein